MTWNFRTRVSIFNPELAIINQITIGADIIMCLDQCIAYGAARDQVREAMRRTHRWAQECCRVFAESDAVRLPGTCLALFKGAPLPTFAEDSAEFITSLPFSGYAIGGLAVGESKEQMQRNHRVGHGAAPPETNPGT